jgi:hypothetical protein
MNENKEIVVSLNYDYPSKLNFFTIQPEQNNNNVKLEDYSFNGNLSKVSKSELRLMVSRPIEKEKWFRCRIERKYENKIAKYFLYSSENDTLLLSSFKNPKKRSSCYIICLSDELGYSKENNHLAKLQSNYFGTEFCIYDNGKKPKKNVNKELYRHNLGSVVYVFIFI